MPGPANVLYPRRVPFGGCYPLAPFMASETHEKPAAPARDGIAERSLAVLDWPEVIERLAAEARSERGVAACRALPFARSAEEARERIALVGEMASLVREGALPGMGFPEAEPVLDAAEKGAPLDAEELQQVAGLCETAFAVKRFLAARSGPSAGGVGGGFPECPGLWDLAQTIEPREEIGHRVRSTFDAAGGVRDSVSPELARLRRERESLSTRVRDEVERIMQSAELESVLQDRFVTLRADRYVLPLKASAKSLGLGIVHDTSRTGETVFVEPTAVVGLNNRLKLAELEIARETRRILEEITRRVAEAADDLRRAMDLLTRLDVLAAQARLSVAWDGTPPEIVPEPVVDLARARHPLLALRAASEGFDVVANDIALGAGGSATGRVLVISGPNAGGKTVLLKTVALAALLARAGFHVPAAPGSRVGLFEAVLADIGDQQSLAGGLSTFSAHLRNVAGILASAGEAGPRALVLVDELMVGTNPEQGAALARAVLEELADLPGLTITTTHYDSLKALAQGDARFRNAAMEYDLDALAPTYRLRDHVPGRSYALDIAERMGLPKGVLARARALAGATTVGLEDVIARLEAREAALAKEQDALERARTEVEAAAGKGKQAAEALVKRERELAMHSRDAIEDAVREAREALRAIVREAQRAGSARAAEAARQAVERTAQAASEKLPEEPAPEGEPPPVVEVGAAVYVPSLRAEGTIARAPDAKGRVKVTVGAITVDLGVAELRASKKKKPPPPKPPKKPKAAALAEPEPPPEDYAVQTKQNTLDLRGARADDAIEQVEQFLDRSALEGRTPVFVIHGFGTGALRKAVREYLARSPYVRRWRPGAQGQGGDGVVIVDL